jgi:hypothetical protein
MRQGKKGRKEEHPMRTSAPDWRASEQSRGVGETFLLAFSL